MLRLAFDFIITWRETRTRPNAYNSPKKLLKNPVQSIPSDASGATSTKS